MNRILLFMLLFCGSAKAQFAFPEESLQLLPFGIFVPRTLIDQSFEGAGYENPATESWLPDSGAPLEDPDATEFATAGTASLALRDAGPSANVTFYWLGGTTNKSRVEWTFSFATTVKTIDHVLFNVRTNGASSGYVEVTSAGKLRINDEFGNSATTTDAIETNTVYYVRARWDHLIGTDDIEFNTSFSFAGSGSKYARFTGGNTTKWFNGGGFQANGNNVTNWFDKLKITTDQ